MYLPGYPPTVPDDGLTVDPVLAPEVVRRKVRALEAQATQTAGLISVMGAARYSAWVGEESFVEHRRRPS